MFDMRVHPLLALLVRGCLLMGVTVGVLALTHSLRTATMMRGESLHTQRLTYTYAMHARSTERKA